MQVLRDSLYFEPRCVDCGTIRWYGERYFDKKLEHYCDATVYIRDNSQFLYIYKLQDDEFLGSPNLESRTINAVFTLICKIKKNSSDFCYGKKLKGA